MYFFFSLYVILFNFYVVYIFLFNGSLTFASEHYPLNIFCFSSFSCFFFSLFLFNYFRVTYMYVFMIHSRSLLWQNYSLSKTYKMYSLIILFCCSMNALNLSSWPTKHSLALISKYNFSFNNLKIIYN